MMLGLGLKRAVNGFCYAVAINLIIYVVFILLTNKIPLLPEYVARFSNESIALLVQLFLIGLMSAALSGGTVILAMEKLSLLAQSIIYFVFSSLVWVFVGCFCWGLNKYVGTMITFGSSYVVSYIICWIIEYKTCKKDIAQINQKIRENNEDTLA